MYLQGGDPKTPACQTVPLGPNATSPNYLDFGLIHEFMHTIGAAATCAPHSVGDGHVGDTPNDLMYAGSAPWGVPNLVLDYGHNDYYKTGSTSCLDVANSAFLSGGGTQLPPGW